MQQWLLSTVQAVHYLLFLVLTLLLLLLLLLLQVEMGIAKEMEILDTNYKVQQLTGFSKEPRCVTLLANTL